MSESDAALLATEPDNDGWAAIEKDLALPWGAAYFLTPDGHRVSATVCLHKMRLVIQVFVDERFPADWYLTAKTPGALPELPSRFYPVRSVFVYKAKERRDSKLRKAFKAAYSRVDLDAKLYYLAAYWTCPKRFVRHVRTHNPGIRTLTVQEYAELVRQAQDRAAEPAEAA